MPIAGLILLALPGVVLVRYLAREMTDLRVTELDVPIRDLGAELDGYTMAVLSDFHNRPLSGRAYLDRLVHETGNARPDVILLLGDYGVSFKYARLANRWLYRRAARGLAYLLDHLDPVDGVVGVLGNHDHYAGADAVSTDLRRMGVQVLDNTCVQIRRGGAAVLVGGVGDAREGVVDAAGGCGEFSADFPRIILSHNPDAVFALDRQARIDLILSGHTHGGQVVLPLVGAPLTMTRLCTRHTASGWVPNNRAPLYVSRGIGCQIPIRVGCPPELVIVRLRIAAQQAV
jgi:predicted MPP superfamily phosphohydrolase